MIDDKKLQQFLGKMLIELGAAISVPLVRIGVRLGLYKTMDGSGPMTSSELADKANISERYAREWLAQNAASDREPVHVHDLRAAADDVPEGCLAAIAHSRLVH